MSNSLSSDGIEKIIQILQTNQNKINLLRNDLSNNSNDKNNLNNLKIKTNQFLNGLEIDIKNILSLLDRIKIDSQKNNQIEGSKTYCINNDKNSFQDIVICGCCECCRCYKCCNCSTNNCSDNQQINISNNNINNKAVDNEYIKENINPEENNNVNRNNQFMNIKTFNGENNNLNNLNNQPTSPFNNINYTFPGLNYDDNFNSYNNSNNNYKNNDYNALIPNNDLNLIPGNREGKIIYSNYAQKHPSPQLNNDIEDEYSKPYGYIKKPFLNIEDNNLPIQEKVKNSAIIKSKRFHPSKSLDSFEFQTSPKRNKAIIISSKNKNITENNDNNNYIGNKIFNPNANPNNNKFNNFSNLNKDNNYNNNLINYNNNLIGNNYDKNNIYDNNNFNRNNNINYNNDNLGQKKKKMNRMNQIQAFMNKLYNQSDDVVYRFKKIYGDDIGEKLLKGEIDDKTMKEMGNILDKIIKMSIWGEDDKDSKNNNRGKSSSYDKKDIKRKHRFVYNPIKERIKLLKAINDKQAYFKEYPRGWYSTKEYFINNGTEINNDNLNKYN